ncbi:MAG TPA: tyrosine-type recombinase/integrase [Bryobacteraceae bacterium]|jgi:integrase
MPLSDVKARNAKPRVRRYKITDAEGLYLLVTPAGGKYWRLKYFFEGKEKLLALGIYPNVSLAEARDGQRRAQANLAAGKDPNDLKRDTKLQASATRANTFGAVATEWFEHKKHRWSSATITVIDGRLKTYLLPKLGPRPVSEITAAEVLAIIRPVEAKGTLETARRLRQICGQVFRYAIVTGKAERNPVPDLKDALKTPVAKHYAFLRAKDLPEFLQKLKAYDGDIYTKLALEALLLTFVRTGELRGATWAEIDWEMAEWRIPAERMKMKELHIVPLSRQGLVVLRELQKHSGAGSFLFPNRQNPLRPMSENTMLYALYRMGYHSRATSHGFRSTASTILNEHAFRPDVIERQLAHADRDSVRAAYNHAQYIIERREMMQWWADYLDRAVTLGNPIETS